MKMFKKMFHDGLRSRKSSIPAQSVSHSSLGSQPCKCTLHVSVTLGVTRRGHTACSRQFRSTQWSTVPRGYMYWLEHVLARTCNTHVPSCTPITAYQLNPFPNPRKPVGFTAVYVYKLWASHGITSSQVNSVVQRAPRLLAILILLYPSITSRSRSVRRPEIFVT